MRKILGIGAFMAFAISTGAQSIQEVKIGPEIGATYATMYQKLNREKRDNNYQLGFKAGAVADLKFTDNIFVQPGLFLSINNGAETYYERFYKTGAGTPASDHDRRTYKITYVQLPVYALYKTGKEFDDPHFFFGIGPSFNYAIGGNFQQEYINTLNGVEIAKRYDYSMPFGNNRAKDKLRRFDLAANVTIGFEAPSGLLFRANYSIGLLNVAPDGNTHNRMRNTYFGLSVGYLFRTDNRPHWDR